jgi:hypothetical protein
MPFKPAKKNEDGQLVGIENLWEPSSANLKWHALMFDRIGALFLDTMLLDQTSGRHPWWSIADLRWLVEQGFLFDPGFSWLEKIEELHQRPEYVQEYENYRRALIRRNTFQNELGDLRDSLQSWGTIPD